MCQTKKPVWTLCSVFQGRSERTALRGGTGTMGGMRVVFVPGSGREGAAAWPRQGSVDWSDEFDVTYLEHCDLGSPAEGVLRALGDRGGHVVAHSGGAVAATLAAARRDDLVHSLVLFEPACFALARGGPEVERHIAELSPVFSVASDPAVADSEFATRFLAALGAPPPLPPEPALAAIGRRMRAVPPPWGYVYDSSFLASVRSLVVTGGWNALYDEVAAAMQRAGAKHVVVAGHEHRPQDDEMATRLLLEHWRS